MIFVRVCVLFCMVYYLRVIWFLGVFRITIAVFGYNCLPMHVPHTVILLLGPGFFFFENYFSLETHLLQAWILNFSTQKNFSSDRPAHISCVHLHIVLPIHNRHMDIVENTIVSLFLLCGFSNIIYSPFNLKHTKCQCFSLYTLSLARSSPRFTPSVLMLLL